MKSAKKLPAAMLDHPPAPHRPWRKWALIAFVTYTVLGFLILPVIVKWQLRKQLPALTHRQAEVKQVRMNPFALSLTVRGLALTETNGTAFAAFDELYVNFQLSSIFRWAWTFGEIRLVHPTANLIRFADGSFNFSNLLSTNTSSSASTGAPPPVLIQSLRVTNAVISVADFTTPRTFRTEYGPIDIAFQNFNTHREKEEPYSFVATTGDGESFAWAGNFSLNQLRSSGKFKFTGIPPEKYGPYLAQFATVQLQRGKLDLGATYRVNAARQPLELEVTDASVELRDFLVKPPERDVVLLAIERFKVSNTSASLTGQVARVGLVEINGGSVFLERATNGFPQALSYLIPQSNAPALAARAASHANASPASPWQFQLADFALTNFNLTLEDHSTEGVAEIGLDNLAIKLKGLSNQSNAPIELAVAFDWRGGGAANLATHGTLLPPNLATKLVINNFALAPVQPYLGQHLNLVVHSGGLNVQGEAKINPAAAPQLQFIGDVGITNFSSSDTIAYHELASWQNHLVQGIEFALKPNRLAIKEIKFVGARNHLAISSNGVLNVQALVKLPTETNAITAAAVTNVAAREMFPIQVGALVFENGAFRLVDDSLLRRLETHVEEFNGSVRNIVLPGANKAEVDIRGKVSSLAPFEIVGAVTPDPRNLFVDLKIAFTNTDLTSLSPYMEKFVGRPLTKGKLTSEQKIHVENLALTAVNLIRLDQLTLGGRMESPFATKLPVKLAIGLLKDMEGSIELDLPMSGKIDDPEFSVWGLVGQTMQNLILRLAASPFSLLGALAGGGEELQFVDFTPGLVALNENQTNKVMKLAEALAKRPALSLEISAMFDAALDSDALGRQKVAQRMKTLRIEEIVARSKPAPALAELQLEDSEYERLLRKAYRTAFNVTPEQALYEKLAVGAATNAVGPASALPIVSTRTDSPKGAAVLLGYNKSLTKLAAASGAASSSSDEKTKPKSEKELVRDELEQRLATLAPVTTDELRGLMQQRIEVVQKFLQEQAGVAADRLLPTNPNPEDPNRKGAARVVFTLE